MLSGDKPAPATDVPSLPHLPKVQTTGRLDWLTPRSGRGRNQTEEEKQEADEERDRPGVHISQ